MLTILFLSSLMLGQSEVAPASSLISALPSRNIPFIPAGERIGAVAVYNKDPKIFYIGSCNGGVMKTTDGGHSSNFVFDKIGSCSIGSLAMSQKNPDVVWVGTGDKWQRNTVGMGDGVYKTTDGGKTWQDMGLKKTYGIGQIAIDPTNDNIVMVAALGSPWGYGPDRGIYKTADGGKTWKKVLYTNEKCAGNDVQIDPKNPKNMLASLYDHIHYVNAWWFGGPGSGIYRSTDGGETWHKAKGLPEKDTIGRINVGYFSKNPKICAASVEVGDPKNSGIYTSKDGGETWTMQPGIAFENVEARKNNKPREANDNAGHWGRPYYNSQEIHFDPNDPNRFYFGSTYHYTDDGGKTVFGFSGDGHGCWINPNDGQHGMCWGDGGLQQQWHIDLHNDDKSYATINIPCVFQTYGVGYDMRKLYSVMGNSQDDGAYASLTQGTKGYVSGSDRYSIGGDETGRSMADPEDWTIIYAAHRYTSLNRLDLKTGEDKRIEPDRKVWSFNDYNYKGVKSDMIRSSWYNYFEISPWNSKTLYMESNRLLKSVDRGDTWQVISPDLTHNNLDLVIESEGLGFKNDDGYRHGLYYQTIQTINESPLKQGVIWCGTDDGYVQLTKDGGKTWENVTKNIPGLPEYTWCSKIEASKFAEGRAYAVFNNHRRFDLKSYVYVTEDYGQSWTKITGNLPDEPCRALKEGLKNPDLLCLGTEFGVYISLDRGKSWDYYQDWTYTKASGYTSPGWKGYFPRVAVYDLQIHPRENDLLIAAHGRGIWIVPIKALEEMTAENRAKDVYLPTPGNVYLFPTVKTGSDSWPTPQRAENTQPGTLLCCYLKSHAKGEAEIKFQDAAGNDLMKKGYNGKPEAQKPIKTPIQTGLNSVQWMNDGMIEKPGDYRVVWTIDGKDYVQKLHVEDATAEVIAGAKAKYLKEREELAKNRR